jgi:hypothetical protein
MQPPLILLVLIIDRVHMTYRSIPERADLFRPTDLPLGQEIDHTPLAHIALHPRCSGITARTVDAQADPQGIQDAAQRPRRLEQVRSSAAQLVPSGLVIVISQSRPLRLAVSGHRCSIAPASTRIR